MPAFNTVAGMPMTANVPLLVDLLRRRWGFDGVVVSDYNAIAELIAHGLAADPVEAAALALRAGIDIDMMAGAYEQGLPAALERGLVEIEAVDRAVGRVLALKERLGLLDAPCRRGAVPLTAADWTAHRALARDAARRSIVLMTNRGRILPLRGPPRRLAVLGPLAASADDMLGPWAGAGLAADCVTPLEGIREALPGWPVDHADGLDHEAAAALAARADLVILCLGERRQMSGEAASRGRLDLPDRQEALARAVLATGRPVIVLLSAGRPLPLPWLFEAADAVLMTWFLGVEAGHAMADVLTGAWNPSGRLPVSWPADVGQIPIFLGRRATGRPPNPAIHYSSKYLDLPTEPLFPFGHGLSYSRFSYGSARAEPAILRAGERLRVEVEVTNAGETAAEETVLLFIRDPVASVTRPLLELKGMVKLWLEPGASATARIELAAADLAGLGPDLQPCLEPGTIELWLGPTASPERLTGTTIEIAGP
jgi:beta-glucosidase